MNTYFKSLFSKILISMVILTVVLTQVGTFTVSAQENNPPKPWTTSVCNGEAAIVFQSRQETGDGVTVAPYDKDECDSDTNLGWYVVEPWNPDQINPDAGCLAETWSSVGVMARETTWENGSAWRVNVAKFAKHPMVVSCSEVGEPDDLGLNPNENQVQLDRQGWVISRALELLQDAGMTPAQYCSGYDEPLANYLCALPAFTNAAPAATPNPGNSSNYIPSPPWQEMWNGMGWVAFCLTPFVIGLLLLGILVAIIFAIARSRTKAVATAKSEEPKG